MVQTQLFETPPEAPLLNGFRLESRAQNDRLPHHMSPRNGANVAQKLLECSLYRSDLDRVIRDGQNTVAAYGLFWIDPVTHIGLIEPMRTADPFQRMGLATGLISEGIQRLREAGASIIKVSYEETNEAAAWCACRISP